MEKTSKLLIHKMIKIKLYLDESWMRIRKTVTKWKDTIIQNGHWEFWSSKKKSWYFIMRITTHWSYRLPGCNPINKKIKNLQFFPSHSVMTSCIVSRKYVVTFSSTFRYPWYLYLWCNLGYREHCTFASVIHLICSIYIIGIYALYRLRVLSHLR